MWWTIGIPIWVVLGLIVPIYYITGDLRRGFPFKVRDLWSAIFWTCLGPTLLLVFLAAIITNLCDPLTNWISGKWKAVRGLNDRVLIDAKRPR